MTKFNLFFSVPAFPGISIIVNYFFWLHTYSKLFSIPGCIQKRTKNVAGIRKKNMFYSWIYECILLTCLTIDCRCHILSQLIDHFFIDSHFTDLFSTDQFKRSFLHFTWSYKYIAVKSRQALKRYFSVVILFSIGILSWHLFDFSDCILMRLDNWEIILGYDRELSACFVRSP